MVVVIITKNSLCLAPARVTLAEASRRYFPKTQQQDVRGSRARDRRAPERGLAKPVLTHFLVFGGATWFLRHSGASEGSQSLQGEPAVPKSLLKRLSQQEPRSVASARVYHPQLHRGSRRAVDATGAESPIVTRRRRATPTAGQQAAMAPKKRKSAAKTKTATKKKAASPKQPKKAAPRRRRAAPWTSTSTPTPTRAS